MLKRITLLSGDDLDWSVAYVLGVDSKLYPNMVKDSNWNPSSNWIQGGKLIEKFKVSVKYENNSWWSDVNGITFCIRGETPLQSAMRAIVDYKLWDSVELDVPEMRN